MTTFKVLGSRVQGIRAVQFCNHQVQLHAKQEAKAPQGGKGIYGYAVTHTRYRKKNHTSSDNSRILRQIKECVQDVLV